jgi:shikimate kinase
MSESGRIERVVLVGFLGAGKSVVGRALALRLDWALVDFDAEIKQRERMPLGVVVGENGADYLREAELALTEVAARRQRLVIAPGGAWITRPGLLELLGLGTLAVWLKVSPSEAFKRIRASTDDHPWRDDPNALDRVGNLMRERESHYRLCDLSVPTNWRSPEAIAFEIEQIIRSRGVTLSGTDAHGDPPAA